MSEQLLELIRSGHYPVGSKLPTEMQLCGIYNVGRHTAREAIRKLSEMGLIERRRRAGTTVVRQHPRPQFGLELDTTDQLQRYLKFTDLHVLRHAGPLTRQPAEVALEGDPADWIKIETYRSVPGSERGISWTDIYLRTEYGIIAPLISTQPGGVYPLLEEHCGEIVETIEMEISAVQFPPHVARFLGYDATEPALLVIRTFKNPSDKIMEVAISFYPPYEFRYATRLSRNNGYHRAPG